MKTERFLKKKVCEFGPISLFNASHPVELFPRFICLIFRWSFRPSCERVYKQYNGPLHVTNRWHPWLPWLPSNSLWFFDGIRGFWAILLFFDDSTTRRCFSILVLCAGIMNKKWFRVFRSIFTHILRPSCEHVYKHHNGLLHAAINDIHGFSTLLLGISFALFFYYLTIVLPC